LQLVAYIYWFLKLHSILASLSLSSDSKLLKPYFEDLMSKKKRRRRRRRRRSLHNVLEGFLFYFNNQNKIKIKNKNPLIYIYIHIFFLSL